MKPTEVVEALGGKRSFTSLREDFNNIYRHLKDTDFKTVPPVYDLEGSLNSVYRQVNRDTDTVDRWAQWTETQWGKVDRWTLTEEELLIRLLKTITLLKVSGGSDPLILWSRYKGELKQLKAVTV
jgi:hypothetical protein